MKTINGLFSSLRTEFAISRLRRCESQRGVFILRCSPKDYDRYFLSFVVEVSVCLCGFYHGLRLDQSTVVYLHNLLCVLQCEGQLEFKHCLVVRSHSGEFVLNGAKCSFPSLSELLQRYRKEALRSDRHVFQLSRCCPPRSKGETPRCGRRTAVGA